MEVDHEKELLETCTDFFDFSLELISDISPDNKNLKFAVVNTQITLELFIKYYFVQGGKLEEIIVNNKNDKELRYKDFTFILSKYFKQTKWSYGKKKELKEILHARNAIVHKGLRAGWNNELAMYLVKCIMFIQGTMLKTNSVSLFENFLTPHPVSKNEFWKEGVLQFIEKLALTQDFPIYDCSECGINSLVPNSIGFTENIEATLDCLCCFKSYNLEVEATLIDCYSCEEPDSYLIDRLNGSENQEHTGKCLECNTDTLVKKCWECEYFYHPFHKEYEFRGKFFCSVDCKEIHME